MGTTSLYISDPKLWKPMDSSRIVPKGENRPVFRFVSKPIRSLVILFVVSTGAHHRATITYFACFVSFSFSLLACRTLLRSGESQRSPTGLSGVGWGPSCRTKFYIHSTMRLSISFERLTPGLDATSVCSPLRPLFQHYGSRGSCRHA